MFSYQFGRSARIRSRLTSALLVVGAAVLPIATIGGTPANGAVATPAMISFNSGEATFHVGGHAWVMNIQVAGSLAFIALSTTHEFDSWSFGSWPAADFKANGSTGNATFDSHNSFAPEAFVNLKFTAKSRRSESCSHGSETAVSGSASGSVTLVATKRLKFKSAHVSFKSPVLLIDRNCVLPPGPVICANGVWTITGGALATGTTPGLPGRETYSMIVNKSVTLARPADALLFIQIFANTSKPVFDAAKKTLDVAGGGPISGSALLKATSPPTVHSFRCTLSGKHFKARDASYQGSFTSPKGGELQARSIVVGLIKVTHVKDSSSFFDVVTIKPVT
jgi:hypothetical protein